MWIGVDASGDKSKTPKVYEAMSHARRHCAFEDDAINIARNPEKLLPGTMERATPAHRNGTVPVMASQADLSSLTSRPTVDDIHGDNPYAEAARKYWLKSTKTTKVLPKVIKEELWDKLDNDGFPYGSLLILETLQILERYVAS
jgi:hypothetical protein